jgi:hypothetical protein
MRGSSGAGRTVIWVDEEDIETDDECVVRLCPLLRTNVNYEITSPRTPVYNCLAWALGIEWAWITPEENAAGYYWFPGVEREWSVVAIRKIFERVGYTQEAKDTDFESGYEKVVFYVEEDGSPLHFAKQLKDGRWTSKLGRANDIAHNRLEDLEGKEAGYGKVGLILKRPLFEQKQNS